MNKWLNYHHLIYFKTIASEGSISKASEVLTVGQPALSSQLKSFEEYLGVRLFDRKNKKLILTEAGKVTLEYANQINSLGQELLDTIESKELKTHHHLSVGALDSIPKQLILDVIEIAKDELACHFTIIEDSTFELVKKLTNHELDIILSDHPFEQISDSRITSHEILLEKVCAYGSKQFKGLSEDFPRSLNNAPVILPTDHSQLRFKIDQFALKHSIDYEVVAQTQDTAVKKLMALKGDGIVFLPPSAAKKYLKNNELFLIGELEDVITKFYIITSQRFIKNPAQKLILEQDFKNLKRS